MDKKTRAYIRITLGVIFLILGIIGSLLPVLQGWFFFLLALMMFFPNHPRAHKLLIRLERRTPRLVRWLRKLGVEEPPVAGEDASTK